MTTKKTSEAEEALERLYGPQDEAKLPYFDWIKLRMV
jgi:hypothetical protein